MYAGYPPHEKNDIPITVINRVADQLGLNVEFFESYKWKNRVWYQHISIIRDHTGYRPFDAGDIPALSSLLIERANESPSRKELLDNAVNECRENGIELPSERELQRIVNSARNSFFEGVYKKIYNRIPAKIRKRMYTCLKPGENETTSYDWMKSKAGRLGMRNLIEEISKLKFIREFELEPEVLFKGISLGVLRYLKGRAQPEDSYQMRRHPATIRYSLMALLLHFRQQDVMDNIIRSFLELIRRIEKKADKSLEVKLVKNIRKVYGKSNILYKIAKVSTENPEGTIQDVIFKAVGVDVLKRIVDEFDAESQGADYDSSKTRTMKVKYSHHYRKMLKPVLETLRFQANNPAQQPLIDGLALVNRYVDSRCTYYPDDEDIPDELIKGHWINLVYQETNNGTRVARYYFELCVLQKLEKALKCKEVWVEGAFLYRNPDLDLPQDWDQRQIEYCDKLNIPQTAEGFIDPIRKEMTELLESANLYFSRKRDVYIYYPGGGSKGLFRIPKIKARPERPILQEIKNTVLSRWGILDLLDVLIEADRHVEFSRFFYSTGQRQILDRRDIKERLILCLFGMATNLGLKRIHAATQPDCSYDDLLYFRKRFVNIDPVRSAIAALTNTILKLRNPAIWGCSTACASDGKYIGSWDQNLVAEWNQHYQKTGVMAYWHVDTNATCVYSQIKSPMSSQVAAMIKGLILHDTEMRIESNFVDSHGQSEVAFPFCRFIGVELRPRLKRMKYERLYLPDKGMESHFAKLKGVLSRPIRWQRVLHEENMLHRMQPEDFNALTPLFTLNINPYGYFSLDFEKPSILEAA